MNPGEMNVLLTGSTGGIGSELAMLLGRRGARLLLTGRDQARLAEIEKELSQDGASVSTIVADVSKGRDRESLVEAAKNFHGGINVLINNAGVNQFAQFESQQESEIERVIETNVISPMLLCKSMLPQLRRQPRALVVNIGSILGSIGLPNQVAYCATKFALHGFSEALRRELEGSSVGVIYVAPRSTDTGMNDGRQRAFNEQSGANVDSPGFVAEKIAGALEREISELFIGWPERSFVKLNALIPTLVDRSLRQSEVTTNLSVERPTIANGANQ